MKSCFQTSTTRPARHATRPQRGWTRSRSGAPWAVGLLALALLAAPGGAGAQIAAPRLVPAGPSIFDPSGAPGTAGVVPLNPAALQWASPSMVGGGSARTDSTWTAPPRTPAEPTFNTFYGGGRWVGESISIAGEALQLEDVENNLGVRGSSNRAAAAMQLGNTLALGVGYDSASVLHAQFTTDNVSDAATVVEAGVSLRLWESWFLGGSIGRETNSRSATHFLDREWNVERDVAKYAVGYRQGGSLLLHIEVGAVEKPEVIDQAGTIITGVVAQYGTIELNVFNILLGYAVTNLTVSRQERTAVVTQADIGWVPTAGFAITARQERLVENSDVTPPGGGTASLEYEHVTNSVTVTYSFF